MIREGPSYSSASVKARIVCQLVRPEGNARNVHVAVRHRHQSEVLLPEGFPGPAANFAIAPTGVDLDICPVFEYTSVSSTRTFTLRRTR